MLEPMLMFLFSPVFWLLPSTVLLAWAWRRAGRSVRVAGVAICLLLLLACLPLGANLLERVVEARVPADAWCVPAATGPVVVLAGGFDRPATADDDYRALTSDSWHRLRFGVELWRSRAGGVLWITGGGHGHFRESQVLARLAGDWGVPQASLRTESTSTTTWESAFALARALRGAQARVVTSPAHRARALVAFRAAGVAACVQDTGSDVVPAGGIGYAAPQASAIARSENALYELAGLAWYRWRAARAGRGPASGQ